MQLKLTQLCLAALLGSACSKEAPLPAAGSATTTPSGSVTTPAAGSATTPPSVRSAGAAGAPPYLALFEQGRSWSYAYTRG